MSVVQVHSEAPPAGIAHLVERSLAKAEVAGSSPVSRSTKNKAAAAAFSYRFRRHGQAVRHGSAKPSSPVRFRVAPPKQKHPKEGAFVLGVVLPQSKRRVSASSMRVDAVVNEAPVGLQSRIVTEP